MNALILHPLWQDEPQRNSTLYYVWDFIRNSKRRIDDYDNIKAGTPVQHPEQFRSDVGTGETAALKVFQDVCSRTMMLNMLVNDTTGKAGIITGNAGPALDFGQDDKNAVAALDQACPEEHVMAGMMG